MSGWQKGDRRFLYLKVAWSKSTVSDSEIDNFRRANRRFAKKQTVDLQAWNRQFGQVKSTVCFFRLDGLKTTALNINTLRQTAQNSKIYGLGRNVFHGGYSQRPELLKPIVNLDSFFLIQEFSQPSWIGKNSEKRINVAHCFVEKVYLCKIKLWT